MIFWELFWTFLKIGVFTFGGGAAMVALIQDEVTVRHGWLSPQEFTDVLAVSQMTPGPIGINTATYTGYAAVANAGYGTLLAVAGGLLASLAVVLLPVLLMVLAVRLIGRHRGSGYVEGMLAMLRLTAVGLIAAAALRLATADSFGQPAVSVQFVASLAIFGAVLLLALRRKNPIWLMLGSGLAGLLLYGLV